MTRVGILTIAVLVVTSIVGWLLLRDGGDGEGDSVAVLSPRAVPGEADTRDHRAAPTPLPSDPEGTGEQTTSPEAARPQSLDPRTPSRSARAIESSPPEHQARRFDGRALEEAGFLPHEVEDIRGRWEEAEEIVHVGREPLDPNMPGVTEEDLIREQHEVDSAMRERLGDDDYDAGRFATGQNNRVEILGVLEGTVHDSAGLQSGDLVIEFDGKPIYTPEEYLEFWGSNRLAGNGEIILTIEREGELFTVALPEGDHLGPFGGVSLPPE
jgi:hypothetical protein